MKFKNKADYIGSIVSGGLVGVIAIILIISGQVFLGAGLGLLLWCAIVDPFGFGERAKIRNELEQIRQEQKRQRKEQETLAHAHSVLAKCARRMWPELTNLMIAEVTADVRQKTSEESPTPSHT
jgi:hypothetical protein